MWEWMVKSHVFMRKCNEVEKEWWMGSVSLTGAPPLLPLVVGINNQYRTFIRNRCADERSGELCSRGHLAAAGSGVW